MKTRDLENILSDKKEEGLDLILDEIKENDFSGYLASLIKDSGQDNAQIIRASNIERTYFYQILNGRKRPGKDKVVALALSVKLDLETTNRLLKLSGNPSLYPKIKRDAILIYCLGHKYDVYETNSYLLEHAYEVLQ